MNILKELIKKYENANILILGNGPTGQLDTSEYWNGVDGGGYTWAVNGNWQHHPETSLAFMMDDWLSPAHDEDFSPRKLREERLKATEIPVMTNTAYEGFDCFVEYPLVDIVRHFNDAYFGETISYMVAFAIYCGVKRIDFHGTDYMGCKPAERACTEHWVGRAKECNIEVKTNPASHFMRTILDGKNNHIPSFYGYIPESFPFDFHVDEAGSLHLREKI